MIFNRFATTAPSISANNAEARAPIATTLVETTNTASNTPDGTGTAGLVIPHSRRDAAPSSQPATQPEPPRLFGFDVVESFKYLGFALNPKLDFALFFTKNAIGEVKAKFSWLMRSPVTPLKTKRLIIIQQVYPILVANAEIIGLFLWKSQLDKESWKKNFDIFNKAVGKEINHMVRSALRCGRNGVSNYVLYKEMCLTPPHIYCMTQAFHYIVTLFETKHNINPHLVEMLEDKSQPGIILNALMGALSCLKHIIVPYTVHAAPHDNPDHNVAVKLRLFNYYADEMADITLTQAVGVVNDIIFRNGNSSLQRAAQLKDTLLLAGYRDNRPQHYNLVGQALEGQMLGYSIPQSAKISKNGIITDTASTTAFDGLMETLRRSGIFSVYSNSPTKSSLLYLDHDSARTAHLVMKLGEIFLGEEWVIIHALRVRALVRAHPTAKQSPAVSSVRTAPSVSNIS
jgi:hypothetical protein